MLAPTRRTSNIINLFWFLRNAREWETAKKRKLYYEIHKEKVYLFSQGFTELEIKLICKHLKSRNCHLFPCEAIEKLKQFNASNRC